MTSYLYIILICCIYYVAGDVPIVNTSQGSIRGLEGKDGDYFMYLGIPYGLVDPKNPFGPASPHPTFEEVFTAADDSAICPQLEDGFMGSLDCLHLSIFTPSSADGLLPVLIFIHGGAFENGFHGRYLYGPKFIVRHDVILVTLNYRLGPYGYMCTDSPRVPGNQALRDQLLALRWINENIRNFGGDPEKVTLSGNSAGAMSADLLIISETPKVFQQVILQSGVSFLPSFSPTEWDSPLKLSRHFGLETSDINEALEFIATVHPSEILTAWKELGLEFRPCIEKKFEGVEPILSENWVAKDVIDTAKDLNIMIGFNENEALVLFLVPSSDLTNIVNQSLSPTFAIDHPDFVGLSEVREFFFGDEVLDQTQLKNAIDLQSDVTFVYTSMRAVKRYLKSGVKDIFLYLFSYDGHRNIVKSMIDTTIEGAAHADEVGYLYDVSYFGEPSVEDQLVIDRMTELWTNFVKFGNPTPQPSELVPVKWEPVTPSSYPYIHIDSDITVGINVNNERVAFWDLFHEINEHLQSFILDNK